MSPQQQRILDVLARAGGEWMRAEQLVELTGAASHNSLKVQLHKMRAAGMRIEGRHKFGGYRLAPTPAAKAAE